MEAVERLDALAIKREINRVRPQERRAERDDRTRETVTSNAPSSLCPDACYDDCNNLREIAELWVVG
jgi:hypothetical protein